MEKHSAGFLLKKILIITDIPFFVYCEPALRKCAVPNGSSFWTWVVQYMTKMALKQDPISIQLLRVNVHNFKESGMASKGNYTLVLDRIQPYF